ncbi:MAG TPA: LysE family translocator [Candidatus Limnocylindria bacterium]|nr:LysE family translocator [Candidatus Limnocylindria bacterium]
MDARFGAWLAVSAVLIVTPGPDTALVIRNALRSGARAASLTALGVGVGSLAWAVAAALGIGLLLERSATAFTGLKLAGAAYLIYLGLRSIVGASRAASDKTPLSRPGSAPGDRGAIGQGLVNNLLNPKAGAFFVTILPQFVMPGDTASRLVLMILGYEVMVVGWLVAYGIVVSRARRRLVGSRVQRWMERATGAVLLALGVRLALERR